jgi:hypothetical protein
VALVTSESIWLQFYGGYIACHRLYRSIFERLRRACDPTLVEGHRLVTAIQHLFGLHFASRGFQSRSDKLQRCSSITSESLKSGRPQSMRLKVVSRRTFEYLLTKQRLDGVSSLRRYFQDSSRNLRASRVGKSRRAAS